MKNLLLYTYYQEITRFQVSSAIVDRRQYVLKLGPLQLDTCSVSSSDETLVNEKSFTILIVISCFTGIVEAMGLLLGVSRLLPLGLFLILSLVKRFSIEYWGILWKHHESLKY